MANTNEIIQRIKSTPEWQTLNHQKQEYVISMTLAYINIAPNKDEIYRNPDKFIPLLIHNFGYSDKPNRVLKQINDKINKGQYPSIYQDIVDPISQFDNSYPITQPKKPKFVRECGNTGVICDSSCEKFNDATCNKIRVIRSNSRKRNAAKPKSKRKTCSCKKK
jgi:hypothetical protein